MKILAANFLESKGCFHHWSGAIAIYVLISSLLTNTVFAAPVSRARGLPRDLFPKDKTCPSIEEFREMILKKGTVGENSVF